MLLLSLVTALIWAAAWANLVAHCHWSRLLCGFAQVPCAFVVSLQLYFQVIDQYQHTRSSTEDSRSIALAGRGVRRLWITAVLLTSYG